MKKLAVVVFIIIFAGAIYYFIGSNNKPITENNQTQEINSTTALQPLTNQKYHYAITLLDKESLNKYYALNSELKNKPIDNNVLPSLKGEEYEEFESINNNLYQASIKSPLDIEYKKDGNGFIVNFISDNKVINYIKLEDKYNCLYVMKNSIDNNKTVNFRLYCD